MFHRCWVLGIVLCVLGVDHARAQEALPSSHLAQSFSRLSWHELENGMLVVLDPSDSVSTVTVAVGVQAGQRDVPHGWSGLVHLAEHLLFRAHGSDTHFPNRETSGHFVEQLEQLGVIECNGMTSSDRTVFFETVPASALDSVLWLEAERFTHALTNLDANTLSRERDIVHRERALRDDASTLAPLLVHQILYGSTHPYADAMAEREGDLNAIGLAEMQSFMQRAYTPERLTLAISGRFNPAEVLPRVTELFGALRAVGPPIPLPRVSIPRIFGERRLLVDIRRAHDALIVLWSTPPFGTPEDATLDLVAHTMERRIRERLLVRGRGFDVQVRQQSADLASEFVIHIQVPRRSGTEVPLDAIDAVLNELHTPLDDHELARARGDMLQRWLGVYDSTRDRALGLIRRPLAFPGQRYDPRVDIARYETIDAAAIRQVTGQWLRRNARLVVSLDARPGAPFEGVLVRDLIARPGTP